jgi:hypothetical protein
LAGAQVLSPLTVAALAEAQDYVERCLRDGRLLTSVEAMALAGGEARNKETLYAIARKYAFSSGADLEDMITELERRFPEYA